jgi:hypothetical protein
MKSMTEKVRQLDIAHRDDGDGGYALLRHVLEFAKQLQGNERETLRNELLRLVALRDRTLWGVALEALVPQWKEAISPSLNGLLNEGSQDEEWESHVLLALLRLRYVPVADRAVMHISSRIARGDRTVLPMLAALSGIDAERCLNTAVPFVLDIVRAGQFDKLVGYVPAFVNHFLDNDPQLIMSLIQRLSVRDCGVGRKVGEAFCNYLNRAYVREQIGDARVASLVNDIDDIWANR